MVSSQGSVGVCINTEHQSFSFHVLTQTLSHYPSDLLYLVLFLKTNKKLLSRSSQQDHITTKVLCLWCWGTKTQHCQDYDDRLICHRKTLNTVRYVLLSQQPINEPFTKILIHVLNKKVFYIYGVYKLYGISSPFFQNDKQSKIKNTKYISPHAQSYINKFYKYLDISYLDNLLHLLQLETDVM